MNPFTNRILGYGTKAADQFEANPLNYRKHPQKQRDAVQASLRELGWIGVVVENKTTGRLIDGHERVWQALEHNEDVPYIEVELSEEEERLALAVFDPITYMAETDSAVLDALLREVNTGEAALQELLSELAEENGLHQGESGGEGQEGELPMTRADVPDAVWPTDNDYGVPLLDLRMQAKAFDQPAAVWGAKNSRKARMNGTWLFYTEDYRYEALWADPSPVLNTGCVVAVEPNFSAYSNMPMAVALWQIYRKRWIARWWQQNGLPVWVDLNVAENHAALNLCGVPDGWYAFATRGYSERIDATHREYELAQGKAGDKTPLFLVYGGGKKVKAECERMGWLWMQEDMDTAKGREV